MNTLCLLYGVETIPVPYAECLRGQLIRYDRKPKAAAKRIYRHPRYRKIKHHVSQWIKWQNKGEFLRRTIINGRTRSRSKKRKIPTKQTDWWND